MSADELVYDLPPSLKADLFLTIRERHLARHQFFKEMSDLAMRYVCMASHDQFYMEGDVPGLETSKNQILSNTS